MYFIAILGVIFSTFLTLFITGGYEWLTYFFDMWSLLPALIITIPILAASGLLKDFFCSFRLALGKEPPKSLLELKKAKEAVSLAIKSLCGSNIAIFLLNAIVCLHAIDEPQAIGPNAAVCLLLLFYCAILCLFLLPVQSKLNLKIIEYLHEG